MRGEADAVEGLQPAGAAAPLQQTEGDLRLRQGAGEVQGGCRRGAGEVNGEGECQGRYVGRVRVRASKS